MEEFFAAAGEREPELRLTHEFICRTAPDLKPFTQGKYLGYGPYHYIYATGREGDSGALMLANQKNGISLYVFASNEAGYVAEQHAKELGKADVGKSCIRYKKFDDLNHDTLRTVIQEARAWYLAQPASQRVAP
jgi:hypothetical protein